jgi:hypothetical protein
VHCLSIECAVNDATAIALSRGKLVLLILASFAFIAIGAWMFTLDDAEISQQRTLSNPLLFRGIAVAAALMGALGVIISTRKLFDKRPGLVLSEEGIVDNSSGVAAGLIPWSDIEGFGVVEIRRNKFIVVFVKDPEKFLQRGNAMQRALHRANAQMVGSPVSFSTGTLDMPFAELWELLERYRAKYLTN